MATKLRAPKRLFGHLWTFVRTHRKEFILFTILMTISVVAHAWNMLNFPYFENDEATYTARAWTFITSGQLDVYTYRYDHAPLGWMLLGLWQVLAGGAHIFGSLMASGRVFMLLIHLGATVLVYILAKRFSGGSKLAATTAVLFFALSPIALYFQRRILLDNIMTFWFLLSLYFATQPVKRLKYYLLSAVAFGVAVLTKLNALFFAPAILLIIWLRSHRNHRLHASAYWVLVTGMVISSFFVFALLKGELFSAPLGPDGNPTHVSVVDTFKLQLGRGDFAWPWKTESSFMQNVQSWWLKDWAILSLGAVSTMLLGVIGLRRRKTEPQIMVLVALILLYVAFLARGKIVLDLYIVPLIPLLALAIGTLVGISYDSLKWQKRTLYRTTFRFVRPSRHSLHILEFKQDKKLITFDHAASVRLRILFAALLITGIAALGTLLPTRQYTNDETSNQLAGVAWIKQHVPKGSVIATDNYVYPYLAQEDGFQKVSYFFSTEYDPEIKHTYGGDWRNVEYLVLTHEIVKQIKTGTIPHMKDILDHSTLLADYRQGTSSYIDLPNYISTNGDWVQVYKTKTRNEIVRQDSWEHFKSKFIVDYGQVIDLSNNSLSTSSSQAEAMIRSITENDLAIFDGLWQWSKDHLRYRTDDKLLSWEWEKQANGKYKLGDSNAVCNADQQIVYALLQADSKWPGKGYGTEGKRHAEDWWRQCTFTINGQRFVDSSADGSQDQRLINTGYFRPEIYHYLSRKLPGYDWNGLITNGFTLLDRVHTQYGAIPDWTVMKPDGTLVSAVPLVDKGADSFGYDTLQLVYNTAEYLAASKDARAYALLKQLHQPTKEFAAKTKSPPAQLSLLLIDQSQPKPNATALQAAYQSTVFKPYNPADGSWGNGLNYRDQVWYWQWHYLQEILPKGTQPHLQ